MRDAVRTLLLTVCLGAAVPATCQSQTPPDAPVRRAAPTFRTDRALERDLRALAAKVRGDAGIYVRNLRTGRGVSIRADELFPTASMVKVPIMIAVHDAVARGQLHSWVQAAIKQGAVDRSRSEVVLVNAPSGDYVFCVITKSQLDQRYTNDNEGWVLHRAVSALLWKHFEPRHPFTPAEGAAQFTS